MRHPAQSFGFLKVSRSLNFWILPLGVRGNSAKNFHPLRDILWRQPLRLEKGRLISSNENEAAGFQRDEGAGTLPKRALG